MKKFAYNDATGKTVTCKPGGNLSIGEGINLETGLDSTEIQFLIGHRAGLVEQELLKYPWYVGIDNDVRKSVILDVGFNLGIAGLLHFPHMISALAAGDWAGAAGQLHITEAAVDAQRYGPLRKLLENGQ